MSFATIDDLRSQLGGTDLLSTPAYRAKMLHALPAAKTVEREKFILERCTGKRVLEFGASGNLYDAIRAVAADYLGVDRKAGPGVVAFNLDDVDHQTLPDLAHPDVIVCGEVIEHLGNPLYFLQRLHAQYPNVPVIITVPNAFSEIQQKWLKKGLENVNVDHVAWYSPKTLSVLLERAGYTTGDLAYYNGTGPTAEGLLVVAV